MSKIKHIYRKPNIVTKKIKFQLLYSSFDSFIDGNLLAVGADCPAPCGPGWCAPDAYCKGSICAC